MICISTHHTFCRLRSCLRSSRLSSNDGILKRVAVEASFSLSLVLDPLRLYLPIHGKGKPLKNLVELPARLILIKDQLESICVPVPRRLKEGGRRTFSYYFWLFNLNLSKSLNQSSTITLLVESQERSKHQQRSHSRDLDARPS